VGSWGFRSVIRWWERRIGWQFRSGNRRVMRGRQWEGKVGFSSLLRMICTNINASFRLHVNLVTPLHLLWRGVVCFFARGVRKWFRLMLMLYEKAQRRHPTAHTWGRLCTYIVVPPSYIVSHCDAEFGMESRYMVRIEACPESWSWSQVTMGSRASSVE